MDGSPWHQWYWQFDHKLCKSPMFGKLSLHQRLEICTIAVKYCHTFFLHLSCLANFLREESHQIHAVLPDGHHGVSRSASSMLGPVLGIADLQTISAGVQVLIPHAVPSSLNSCASGSTCVQTEDLPGKSPCYWGIEIFMHLAYTLFSLSMITDGPHSSLSKEFDSFQLAFFKYDKFLLQLMIFLFPHCDSQHFPVSSKETSWYLHRQEICVVDHEIPEQHFLTCLRISPYFMNGIQAADR